MTTNGIDPAKAIVSLDQHIQTFDSQHVVLESSYFTRASSPKKLTRKIHALKHIDWRAFGHWQSRCGLLSGSETPRDNVIRITPETRDSVTCVPCRRVIYNDLYPNERWQRYEAQRMEARIRAWARSIVIARHQAEYDELAEAELALFRLSDARTWEPPK